MQAAWDLRRRLREECGLCGLTGLRTIQRDLRALAWKARPTVPLMLPRHVEKRKKLAQHLCDLNARLQAPFRLQPAGHENEVVSGRDHPGKGVLILKGCSETSLNVCMVCHQNPTPPPHEDLFPIFSFFYRCVFGYVICPTHRLQESIPPNSADQAHTRVLQVYTSKCRASQLRKIPTGICSAPAIAQIVPTALTRRGTASYPAPRPLH
jgi:hypothetical protein